MKNCPRTFLALLVTGSLFLSARAGSNGEVHSSAAAKAEFDRLVSPQSTLRKLAGGMKFTEGPVWQDVDGGRLIFSDIPSDELKVWSVKGGLRTFRSPSHKANGNTTDRKGRILVSCEHGSREVTLTDASGKVSTLARVYKNARLNSPNDIVIKRDGTLWFTDPDYGIERKEREQDGNYVFRLDPRTGELTVVAKGMDKPNGLCFSPDEKTLYVADSGAPRHIKAYDVDRDNTLSRPRVFCTIPTGAPDGIRCDQAGHVWSTAGDGIHVFDGQGHFLGRIPVPETPANLCFGGPGFHTLFITAQTSLYAIDVRARSPK